MFQHITVLGAGVMGHGIAQLFAQAKKDVQLYDMYPSSLEKAKKSIKNSISMLIEKGLLTKEEGEQSLNRIHFTTELPNALKQSELIFEAIPEVIEMKWEMYQKVEELVGSEVIIASNTSAFPLTLLHEHSKYPERFIIMHFFNPAQLVPLVEIVKVDVTNEQIVNAIEKLMFEVGKSPVVLQKEVPGFIANRLQFAVIREALWLLENNVASAEDIDIAMKESLGFRYAFIGPLESMDFGGLDTMDYICNNLLPKLSDVKETPHALQTLVEKGKLGVKTGEGFYTYDGEKAVEKIKKRDDLFVELLKLKS